MDGEVWLLFCIFASRKGLPNPSQGGGWPPQPLPRRGLLRGKEWGLFVKCGVWGLFVKCGVWRVK